MKRQNKSPCHSILGYLVKISTPLPSISFLAFTEHRDQPKVEAQSLRWSSGETMHLTLDIHMTFEITQCKSAALNALIFPKKLPGFSSQVLVLYCMLQL